VFATLLEPAAFAGTFEERLALVQRLGGPYFSSDSEELRQARAAGAQAAYLIVDHEGRDLGAAVRDAVAMQPEIVAIRTGRLSAAQQHNAKEFEELAAALAAAEGFHRMIVAVSWAMPSPSLPSPLTVRRRITADTAGVDMIPYWGIQILRIPLAARRRAIVCIASLL
jgi:predicted NBD/HSP70 family sugar kinase